jgi:clan AA aspartic protease (TIGR02281 family)
MDDNEIQIVSPVGDDFIICPRCKTVNPGQSNFCLNCGTRLRGHVPGKSRWGWPILFLVVLVVALFYFYHRTGPTAPLNSIVKTQRSEAVPAVKPAEKTILQPPPPAKDKTVTAAVSEKTIKIPVGLVVFKDITGRVINEMPAAVVAGGWVALPRRVCLGASSWIFKLREDRQVNIVDGMIGDDDPVGLWRIEEDLALESPELYPWSVNESLAWLSLGESNEPQPVAPRHTVERGYFIEAEFVPDVDDMGLMIQNERVVGWSFDGFAAGGYLWSGDEGGYLRAEIQVDDFYHTTFAGGREEAVLLALAMPAGDYSELERLEALAGAFRYEPRLSLEDTPERLSRAAVVKNIRILVAHVLKTGASREVADIFDPRILSAAGDAALLLDVAQATVQAYGFEEAVGLTESVLPALHTANRQDAQQLKEFFSLLYRDWINTLLQDGDLQTAWQVYRRASGHLPDDAAVHLQAVELALAEDNWQEAQRLLEMRSYPRSLDDKIKNLQAQIARLKGREGKIVINFTPGTRLIPVEAVVNHNVRQKFVVDTGASMVTIPRVTARQLDLVFDERTPLRKVNTAGGIQYAPEVTLASITIEGWTVSNIKALVLDLPEQDAWGLLGLNFLHRFRMDMNTEEGVLLLAPR